MPTPADSPLLLPSSIDTPRLLLRPWAVGDAPGLRDAVRESLDDLLPWIPWAPATPPTLDDASRLIHRWIQEREAGANCIYAAFEVGGMRLVGGIGLYHRVGPGALEIGYWIRTGAHRLGYATEATRALVDAAFALPGVGRVEIRMDPGNRPSRRIPERLGFRLVEEGRADMGPGGAPQETTVFVLERVGAPPCH